MKKFYILVSLFFVVTILLFLASFIYLDKAKHKTYYYVLNLGGHDIGTIRIDKFDTEDKLIYKSISTLPFSQLFTESKSRIVLDRRYRLETYSEDRSANGVTELLYIERNESSVSFLARFESEFAYLDNIPIKKDIFIFEADCPVTYLPLIENYDFRKGGVQGFNALSIFSQFSLPPMKRLVTLTSVKDETLKIDSKKIKTENLLLKIKNYSQGSIWVAKSDRSIVKLEIPKENIKITRTFFHKILKAEKYTLSADAYISKEISFKNKKIELAGTLTVPKSEGAHSAVLLIWGTGPQDREYQGFFTSIVDYLSANGFCVLRFDKRGVGSSGGESLSVTSSDEVEDVIAALEYIAGQKEIDPKKITIISHSESASVVLKVASEQGIVNGLVLMAPSIYFGPIEEERTEEIKRMASRLKWSDEYLKLAARCLRETIVKANSSSYNWAYILGKRVFLRKVRDELSEKPITYIIEKIKIPVLILQGEEDEIMSMEYAAHLDKILGDSGNSGHILTYYGYLGHFFGKFVNDGIYRMHYEVDKGVLENIKNWLNRNMAGE